jgi:hypothetical protein
MCPAKKGNEEDENTDKRSAAIVTRFAASPRVNGCFRVSDFHHLAGELARRGSVFAHRSDFAPSG